MLVSVCGAAGKSGGQLQIPALQRFNTQRHYGPGRVDPERGAHGSSRCLAARAANLSIPRPFNLPNLPIPASFQRPKKFRLRNLPGAASRTDKAGCVCAQGVRQSASGTLNTQNPRTSSSCRRLLQPFICPAAASIVFPVSGAVVGGSCSATPTGVTPQ